MLHHRNDFWTWQEQLQKVDKRNEGERHIAYTVNLLRKIWKARNEQRFNMKWRDIQHTQQGNEEVDRI